MCLLAVQYRLVPESPILVAANREEYTDRPSLTPSIQSGKPRVLCGIDQKAGGTWLGVNQNGLFVGLCNRATGTPLFGQRSRGLLALDLLRCNSASKALDRAHTEFAKTRYEGCNIIIADGKCGYAIHADERQESRLWDIAAALTVPVSFFFEGLAEDDQVAKAVADDEMPLDILKDKEALDLVRSYYAIPETQRRRLFELARVLSDVT